MQNNLSDRTHPLAPAMRDRHVDGDPMEPRLGRGIGAPPWPRTQRSYERFLDTILGRRQVPKDAQDRAQYPVVAVAIEAVEVVP